MNIILPGILIISALLKLYFLLAIGDVPLRYDEGGYFFNGQRLARQVSLFFSAPGIDTLADGFRGIPDHNPLYSIFIGLVFLLAGEKLFAVKLAQILLSTGTVYLIYLLGKRFFGGAVALLSALFVAIYPSLVGYTLLLWPATLFCFLLSLAVLLSLKLVEKGGRDSFSILAGIVWGLATFARSPARGLLPVILVWVLIMVWRREGRKRAVRATAVIAVTFLTLMLPWIILVGAYTGKVSFVDRAGSYTLYRGNNPYIPDGFPSSRGLHSNIRKIEEEAKGVPNRESYFMDRALSHILDHPILFLRRGSLRVAALWSPEEHVPRHILRGWWGEIAPKRAFFWVVTVWVVYLLVMALGSFGFMALSHNSLRGLFGIIFLYFAAVCFIAQGMPRIHIPLMPFIILYATYAIVHMKEIVLPSPLRLRNLLGGALALCFLGMGYMIFPVVYNHYIVPHSRYNALAEWLNPLFRGKLFTRVSVNIIWSGGGSDQEGRLSVVPGDIRVIRPILMEAEEGKLEDGSRWNSSTPPGDHDGIRAQFDEIAASKVTITFSPGPTFSFSLRELRAAGKLTLHRGEMVLRVRDLGRSRSQR